MDKYAQDVEEIFYSLDQDDNRNELVAKYLSVEVEYTKLFSSTTKQVEMTDTTDVPKSMISATNTAR